jgi:hypothetical protein
MINPTSLGKLTRMFGFRLADAPQGDYEILSDDPGRARRAVDGDPRARSSSALRCRSSRGRAGAGGN